MRNSIIVATMKVQMKNSFSRKMFQFTLLVQPILYTFITYFMFLNSGLDNFVSYVILGSGLLSLWSCIVFSSAGDIERERWMGTLSVLFASPTSFVKIIISKIIGNTLLSLFPFLISFTIVVLVFQQPVYIDDIGLLLLMFPFVIFSFVAIAFLFSAIFTLSRQAGILMNCLEYPIFILCGMAFPITVLPELIQLLSYLLSPTWAVIVLRGCVQGLETGQNIYMELGLLMVLSFIYILLGLLMFRFMEKRVREKATLEVF